MCCFFLPSGNRNITFIPYFASFFSFYSIPIFITLMSSTSSGSSSKFSYPTWVPPPMETPVPANGFTYFFLLSLSQSES